MWTSSGERLVSKNSFYHRGRDRGEVAMKEVNMKIRTGMHSYWEQLWIDEPTCRQTKHFFPTLRPEFSNEIMNLKRKEYSAMIQVMTGHNYMARHQNIIDVANRVEDTSPTCPLCNEGEQSSQHVIGECGMLSHIRFKYFNMYFISPPFTNLSRTALVGYLKELPIGELQFFLEEEQT